MWSRIDPSSEDFHVGPHSSLCSSQSSRNSFHKRCMSYNSTTVRQPSYSIENRDHQQDSGDLTEGGWGGEMRSYGNPQIYVYSNGVCTSSAKSMRGVPPRRSHCTPRLELDPHRRTLACVAAAVPQARYYASRCPLLHDGVESPHSP